MRAIDLHVATLAEMGSVLMLTLEPHEGLATVTSESLGVLERSLREWNKAGCSIIVRFAHEMNGSWYAWGQQPEAYVEAFRAVARTVRSTEGSTIMWAPNEAGGYPFTGGPFEATPGSKQFRDLDTNGDGVLSMADDPYGPFYPGDEYVDWVGLTLYHFGWEWPWGENEVPDAHAVISKIRGAYVGGAVAVDHSAVPDFYREFAMLRNKPMAIPETSALFNASRADEGASNFQIKQSWWAQIFSDELHRELPLLRLVMWFEHIKEEQGTEGVIDWRITADPGILQSFRYAIPEHFLPNSVRVMGRGAVLDSAKCDDDP